MPFTKDIVSVTQVNDVDWLLNEPLVYDGDQQRFTVPAEFVTDFASVPRIFVWLIPTYGSYTKAAILHDYLCRTGEVTRRDADGIFRRCLLESGVPFLRRWMMWAAVRLGGRFAGTTPAEFVIWVTVALPAAGLLIVPGTVVAASLVAFWLFERIVYAVLMPFSGKPVVAPQLWPPSK
jgi:hypothetical protein